MLRTKGAVKSASNGSHNSIFNPEIGVSSLIDPAFVAMSSKSKVLPSDDELKSALVALKTRYPSLGISKTHALLLATYPEWTVSEKRTRKILQNEGLVLDTPSPQAADIVYPSSRVIPDLDISRWTNKIEVKFFDKRKGKGLVATQDIEEGETIWREDPFVLAPEWGLFDLQETSAACGYCSTPLDASSPLTLPCPASASSQIHCPYRFCNRLCLSRSAKQHPLLCPAQNPGCIPLLKIIRETRWMALHALAQCTSRVLLSGQRSQEEEDRDWKVVTGFAELGMEERFKYSFNQPGMPQPDREAWKKSHIVYVQAFRSPKIPSDQRSLAKLLKKPINPVIEKALFEYDGFLRGLGRMSLNLEAHGGLYTLHSHLNHSCTPNVSVRHNDRTCLSRIAVVAKRSIAPGEELFVTYINPDLDVRKRRRELQAWGFGECTCVRCLQEAKHLKPEEGDGLTDLAAELKASLGVA